MLTKNEIIGNVLLKELIEIRTDTLWRMLALLFPDGVVNSVNLDTGFFTRTTRIVYTAKAAVHKRNRRVNSTLDNDIDAKDIIRSHSPPYVAPPLRLPDTDQYLCIRGVDRSQHLLRLLQKGMQFVRGAPAVICRIWGR